MKPRAGNFPDDQIKPTHRSVRSLDELACNFVKSVPIEEAIDSDDISSIPSLSHTRPLSVDERSPEPSNKLPGLRGSPRIGMPLPSKPENFLQVTINENSFMPPSPDDPRRCSTGVKLKDCMPVVSPSPDAEVRKALFHPEKKMESEPCARSQVEDNFVPLNKLGFELPLIEPPPSDATTRLSSDTYIARSDSPVLSTIQEGEEISKQNGTYDKSSCQEKLSKAECPSNANISTVLKHALFEEKDKVQSLSDGNERSTVKPKRRSLNFKSKDIETLIVVKSSRKVEKELEEELSTVSVSPNQAVKRKNEPTRFQDTKKSRTITQASRPAVRTGKNPLPPRMPSKKVERSYVVKPSNNVNESKVKQVKLDKESSKKVSQSLPSKPSASRVVHLGRKLHQLKPSKSGIVHHPNPFAARNQFYDERWIDKQERGFTKWLNFILTPQLLEETDDATLGQVDIAKLWTQCTKDVKVPRAPTREVMSMRAYTANREMNRLRRAACKLWQSREVASIIGKVEKEIERLRLVIRKDINIIKDVGMKQELLKLTLSYNPLWLRIGLETVYGELLPIGSNSDLLGISKFLVLRLLSNPDILSEYAHPTVPHSYRDGHQEALNRFALKKFLELVYFLDVAKESCLIRHNPCLFCPDSTLKSSRDILLTFSKNFLSGEGDITKHLACMGYIVHHKQTKLDEFDYAVTSIKTDLRCGLRLTKVAQLVTGIASSSNLRVPAVSRLQKVHNTDVALFAFKNGGLSLPDNISSKDIVDGHREKTLELLWTIIFGRQLESILDLKKLKDEIGHLKRSIHVRARMGDKIAEDGLSWLMSLQTRSPHQGTIVSERFKLLLEWAQLVLAHYNVEVENLTVSWCDGRGLCYLVHHYQSDLIPINAISDETTLTHQKGNQNLDDSLDFSYGSTVNSTCFEKYLENEKKNFKCLFSKVNSRFKMYGVLYTCFR